MTSTRLLCLLATTAIFTTAAQTQVLAQDGSQDGMVFNRIASISVAQNRPDAADEPTSSEIISVSDDGMTVAYSDSPGGGVGLIDISDPAAPKPAGYVSIGDGEPTAVSFSAGKVLAGVNTSESYTEPSGHLAVIDLESQEIEATCDLGGQPDSTAVSPDGSLVAIAIENERDEDVDDGVIPQMPAGYVAILLLADGVPDCDAMMRVELTGLAEVAPEDPEPEFVDFNDANQLAVTLQENNHIVIIDGPTGEIVSDFSAGSVDLEGIDATDDGALIFDEALSDVPREPDTVQWLDENRLAIANEGDYQGGSRGFTIFSSEGEELFEAGNSFEYELIRAGHYPESRSDAKGVEPEGMEIATFGDTQYMFVLSERGSAIGVYRLGEGDPEFLQLLPSGIAPESAIAIPERNLLISANEADLVEDGGARSHIMIYELQEGEAAYPTIVSTDAEDGTPLGFGALSGLAADPEEAGRLFAVNDSYYAMQPTIFQIDATTKPATITGAIRVTRDGQPAEKLDLEGIVTDGEGGFWLANEGDGEEDIPHALYHVDGEGAITEEVAFPEALQENARRFGAEGVTMIDGILWIAMQREWEDDADGMVKLVSYTPESGEWGAVSYPLDDAGEGWIGLSEITASGDFVYIVERDNQIGDAAKIKKLYRVSVSDLQPAEIGGELPVVAKEEVHDFIPDLQAFNGFVVDKLEGFAIDAAGEAFAVTDNDGVDDFSGETFFFSIGQMNAM